MEHPENVPKCSLYQVPPTLKFHENPFSRFSVMLLTDRQTDRQTDKPTDTDENINLAVAEVIKHSKLSITKFWDEYLSRYVYLNSS